MVVRWGRSCPKGFLPVYSTDTEEEAKRLLVLCCPRTIDGKDFIARELVGTQSLENLTAFSDRLEEADKLLKTRKRTKRKVGGNARKRNGEKV